ncbi:MAG TPA: hypothetical protein VFS43_31250 [Polyangiaceae bacterium]|nr:hypothetical protein [Polyangiaceae bacterium]
MSKHLVRMLAFSSALAAAGCSVGGAPSRTDERPAQAAPASPAPDAGRPSRALKDDEVSPALSKRASELLKDNADKPLGTEVPFELGGRRYIARIEQHYREPDSAEPGPKGSHKGVTLYAAE